MKENWLVALMRQNREKKLMDAIGVHEEARSVHRALTALFGKTVIENFEGNNWGRDKDFTRPIKPAVLAAMAGRGLVKVHGRSMKIL